MAPLCGKPLSAADRKAWQQAIVLLSGLKVRNGFSEKDLAAAVGTVLHSNATKRKCEDCGLVQPNFGLPSEGEKKRWCGPCAKGHTGAVLLLPKCEDCKLLQPSFGFPSDKNKRWCSVCAKSSHAGAVRLQDVINRWCEDCKIRKPSFTLPTENTKKQRWCSSCAKEHVGAINAVDDDGTRFCEDCELLAPRCGLLADRKKRWCISCHKVAVLWAVWSFSSPPPPPLYISFVIFHKKRTGRRANDRAARVCAKAHPGAVNLNHKRCEGCKLKQRNFGMPMHKGGDRIALWCAGCAPAGAENVKTNKCETCGGVRPSCGMLSDKKKRWCG
jgi:hypothetical protein